MFVFFSLDKKEPGAGKLMCAAAQSLLEEGRKSRNETCSPVIKTIFTNHRHSTHLLTDTVYLCHLLQVYKNGWYEQHD